MNRTNVLQLLDHGDLVAIAFDDLVKYHGRQSIGGVAHGFKVLERALAALACGRPVERREITIETEFPGPGVRDAFEMATRAVTDGRYAVVSGIGRADAIEAPRGRYCFRIGYRGQTVALTLRPGLVRDEFIVLVRAGAKTAEEKARLDWLKQDMTDRLLALPANEVYDICDGDA